MLCFTIESTVTLDNLHEFGIGSCWLEKSQTTWTRHISQVYYSMLIWFVTKKMYTIPMIAGCKQIP